MKIDNKFLFLIKRYIFIYFFLFKKAFLSNLRSNSENPILSFSEDSINVLIEGEGYSISNKTLIITKKGHI